jgi:ribosome-binding factor A
MTASGHRHERIADQIRDEIAQILSLGQVQDPRVGFTTVTRVELSADLAHARVFVSVLGDEATQHNTIEGLTSAIGYLRREITHRLKLRRSPELTVILDHGPEEGLRIESLLQKLKNNPER